MGFEILADLVDSFFFKTKAKYGPFSMTNSNASFGEISKSRDFPELLIDRISTAIKTRVMIRFFHSIRGKVRSYLQRFNDLSYVTDDAKAICNSKIRHYELRLAKIEYFEQIVADLLKFILALLVLIPVVVAYINIQERLAPKFNILLSNFSTFAPAVQPVVFPLLGLLASALGILLYSVLLMIYLMSGLVLARTFSSSVLGGYILSGLVLAGVTIIILNNRVDLSILGWYILYTLAYVYLIQFGGILVIAAFMFMSSAILTYRKRTLFPDAIVAHKLVDILYTVNSSSPTWLDVSTRSIIVSQLENIAFCIEHDLYRRMRTGDAVTDLWFEQTTKMIAASVRSKERWILTPKADTHSCFSKNILEMLTLITKGDWDSLEKIAPEKIEIKKLWKDRLSDAMRILFIGVFPVLVIWFVQNSSMALTSPISDYAVSVGLLWALFTVVTTLDPMISVKLDAIKEIVNLFPWSNKK